MWWSVVGFAVWFAGLSLSAAPFLVSNIAPERLWGNTALYAALGAALGWLLWRFVFRSPSLPMWSKTAIAAVVLGAPYYYSNSSLPQTMLALLLFCMPIGIIFGAILAGLGVGRSSVAVALASNDQCQEADR
jgi:hypothetical protein